MIPFFRRLPTTDLYFANMLAHLERVIDQPLPAPRQIARHGFLLADIAVVSRYVHPLEVQLIKAFKPRRLVYLIDDDLSAGIADHGLAKGYRKRLQGLKETGLHTILTAATDVVVPNDHLKSQFERFAEIHVLNPLWHRPFADLSHFPSAVAGQGPFKIAFLGTKSHLPDLGLIQFELAHLLKRSPHVEFHHRLGVDAPKVLKALPNVIAGPQLGWRRYKDWIGTERFHLALYPLRPTAFNQARSTNKLFEHAVTGAASLMSPTPASQAMLKGALNEIFITGDESAWAQRIERLITNPILAQTLAARTLMHLGALDIASDHLRIWRQILKL